jgi:hypothetical protein
MRRDDGQIADLSGGNVPYQHIGDGIGLLETGIRWAANFTLSGTTVGFIQVGPP